MTAWKKVVFAVLSGSIKQIPAQENVIAGVLELIGRELSQVADDQEDLYLNLASRGMVAPLSSLEDPSQELLARLEELSAAAWSQLNNPEKHQIYEYVIFLGQAQNQHRADLVKQCRVLLIQRVLGYAPLLHGLQLATSVVDETVRQHDAAPLERADHQETLIQAIPAPMSQQSAPGSNFVNAQGASHASSPASLAGGAPVTGGSFPQGAPGGVVKLGPDSVLGSYVVKGLLGKGGMGSVYKAYHTVLNRTVALKVLPAEVQSDSEAAARFLAEGRAAATIEHDNVVTVYDAGTELGRAYIAMDLIEGESLHSRLKRDGKLELGEACQIARDVLKGLSAAHQKKIIHRDIKPQNILLNQQGRVKVCDFGLARLNNEKGEFSELGKVMGTPRYISPEQASGEEVEARTDLYAVGAVLFEMLAGRPVFEAENSLQYLKKHMFEAPPSLKKYCKGAPPKLIRLVNRLLHKDVSKRPESAEWVIERLDSILLQLAPELVSVTQGEAGKVVAQAQRAARASSRLTVSQGFLVFFVATALGYGLSMFWGMDWPGRLVYDHALASRKARGLSDKVQLVIINDDDVKQLGWPIPRESYAYFTSAVATAGAKAGAFDIVFVDPKEGDDVFGDSLTQTKDMILPFFFEDVGVGLPTVKELSLSPALTRNAKDLDGANALCVVGNKPRLPAEQLLQTAGPMGFVNDIPDSDGVTRTATLLIQYQGQYYPSLSLAAALKALSCNMSHVTVMPGRAIVITPSDGNPVRIPVNDQLQMLIDYPGSGKSFESYPLAPVISAVEDMASGEPLNPELEREFQGKIILLGAHFAGAGDQKPTPVDPRLPGVLIHASVIDNILGGHLIEDQRAASLGLFLGTAILSTALLILFRFPWGGLAALTMTLLVVALSYHALQSERTWIDPSAAIIANGVLVFLGAGLGLYNRRKIERSQTQ